MAQYKVPQDVEADDKLIGPFSFRQFVYLLIAGGLIALAVVFFRIFPILAIIPIPPILLLLVLALPLKKDQPMETYLAAVVSYYLKPRKRIWTPGQRESTILITAPKIVEAPRTRDISGEEATHRLSFLADIVDTQGFAIKGMSSSPMRDDLVAEANATPDMFEDYQAQVINRAVNQDKYARHQDAVREMRAALDKSEGIGYFNQMAGNAVASVVAEKPSASSTTPIARITESPATPPQNPSTTSPKNSIIELANNPDYSVATIAKEANRINGKDKGEVFISLH